MVSIPRVKLTLRDRILSLLDQHPDTEYNAKTIARLLRANYSSVRKELRRMVKEGLIEEVHKKKGRDKDGNIIYSGWSWYRSKNTIVSSKGVVYPTPEIHGIKLEYRGDCHIFKTGSFLSTNFAGYTLHRHRKNHALVIYTYPYIEGEHRDITITIHDNLLEVWVKVTDKPLSPNGLMELSAWLQGKFNLDPSQFKLVQYGLNYDFPGLQMDGVKALTLKQFSNALIRIYQHGKGVRYEIHQANKPDKAITLEQAIATLKHGIEGKRGDEEEYLELRKLIEEMNRKLDLLSEGMTTLIRAENAKILSQDHITQGEKISGEVEGYA